MRRALASCSIVAALAGVAPAQVLWSTPLAGSNVPSEPTVDSSFDPTLPTVYVGQGTKLFAFNALSGGGGAQRWSYTFGGNVQNFPNAVPLSSGTKAVFVAAANGLLYGINASTGTNLWSPVDLRRASCLTADQFLASPAVQLRQYSNAAFQAAHTDDLVMIITRHGCADGSTTNRIYARNASTGTFAWTFNVTATYSMDYGSEGCAIDYDTNRLYCGTNQGTAGQNTLWAISTIDGSLVWAKSNLGSIHTRPQRRGQYLYIGSYAGNLYVVDKDTGAVQWSTVVTTSNITRNVWAELRNGPVDYRDRVFVVDTLGWLYMYSWTGAGSSTAPLAKTNLNGLQVTTLAAVMPTANITGVGGGTGAMYVGASDGTVRQLGLTPSSGSVLDQASFGALGPGRMYDPAIGYNPNDSGALPYSVYLASTAQLTMLKGEWAVGSSIASELGHSLIGVDCSTSQMPPDPCITCTCVGLNCTWQPLADGTACSDAGGPCTCSDDNLLGDGTCPSPPSFYGCPTSGCDRCVQGSCSGSPHTDHDSLNCGSCGIVCPSGTTCQAGKCVRSDYCGDAFEATDLNTNTFLQSVFSGASAIVYERGSAAHCAMYADTYLDGNNNTFLQIENACTQGVGCNVDADCYGPCGTTGATCGGTPPKCRSWTVLQSVNTMTPMSGIGLIQGTIKPVVMGSNLSTPAINNLPIATFETTVITNVSTGTATSDSGPFTDSRFNHGIVGPAEVEIVSGSQHRIYFANRYANGDLWSQDRVCNTFCAWQAAVAETRFVSRAPGQRITAIAVGPRLGHGITVYVAYGTWISALDTNSGTQDDIDLTQVYQPLAGEHPVQAVLSMTVDPTYTDVFVEMKDTAGLQEILIVRGDELTVYNLYDYNPPHGGAPLAGPTLSDEGRITASWTGGPRANAPTAPPHLIRLIPTINGTPTMQQIPLFP
jgi:outer membrane protein assembly factor BamB